MKDTEARRTEIEERMLKREYLHDGAIELGVIGDIDSVPALLVVLNEYPPVGRNRVRACPGEHALAALRKITGANPGITNEAWNGWWEKRKAQSSKGSR